LETIDVNCAINETAFDVGITDEKPYSFWDCFTEIKES